MPLTELVVSADPEALARQGAEILVHLCRRRLEKEPNGRITLALTGGRTPVRLYELLSGREFADRIPWGGLDLFLGDERHVPSDDPRSNAGMISRHLLSKATSKDRFYPVPTELPDPGEAASAYARILGKAFGFEEGNGRWPVFDLILLGVGEDGHIASLFPETEAPEEKDRWVVSLKRPSEDFHRISLTLPVINQARKVLFLVSGKEKAMIVRRILQEGETTLPASRVSPVAGITTWLIDREAASELSLDRLSALGIDITVHHDEGEDGR